MLSDNARDSRMGLLHGQQDATILPECLDCSAEGEDVQHEQLGHMVRRLRESMGLTQEELARLAHVTRQWLGHVEEGRRRRPDRERLEDLARALRIPPDTLLHAAGYRTERLPIAPTRRTPEELVRELQVMLRESPIMVPITSQPASAGAGTLPADQEYVPYVPTPEERGHEFIAVRVTGDCLAPMIAAGHIAIVDRNASPRAGDVVLAVHNSEVMVKILEQRNGDLWLVALSEQPPRKVDEGTRIIGVVAMATYKPHR